MSIAAARINESSQLFDDCVRPMITKSTLEVGLQAAALARRVNYLKPAGEGVRRIQQRRYGESAFYSLSHSGGYHAIQNYAGVAVWRA